MNGPYDKDAIAAGFLISGVTPDNAAEKKEKAYAEFQRRRQVERAKHRPNARVNFFWY